MFLTKTMELLTKMAKHQVMTTLFHVFNEESITGPNWRLHILNMVVGLSVVVLSRPNTT